MRRSGTAFFLGDTAFLSDSRFRALARRLPDADDFNSAVGAWIIALAAARRNGHPELDAEAETGSRFLTDLREVGLLTDSGFRPEPFEAWAPKPPQQVLAGQARAASGNRGERGRFTSGDQRAGVAGETHQPPIPSNQLYGERGPGGGGAADPEAFHRAAENAGGLVASFVRQRGRP